MAEQDRYYCSLCSLAELLEPYLATHPGEMFSIEAFNTKSRYLDDILNINTIYFDNMARKIYNKANTSDTEASFWTCIFSFLKILFLRKIMINVTILILSIYFQFPFYSWRCSSSYIL